jgi:hypothetical protein
LEYRLNFTSPGEIFIDNFTNLHGGGREAKILFTQKNWKFKRNNCRFLKGMSLNKDGEVIKVTQGSRKYIILNFYLDYGK